MSRSPPSTRSSPPAPSRGRSPTRSRRRREGRRRRGPLRQRAAARRRHRGRRRAPAGVKHRAVERVAETLPPALVDLALWIADYYGSTPARALALVAPYNAKRRGERPAAGRRARSRRRRRRRSSRARRTPRSRASTSCSTRGGGNVLLYGATGSGKTEVYLRACEAALARGRGAIVLVPEIALTPQTLGRFRARFGDRVAILHSALTEAERRDERERIASGEAPVVVGARSAVFAPVPSLGVICVDEEHDASYKQESDPRYDARTVAAKRAALERAVAIFGSATPRPESWASARAARARRPPRGAAADGARRRPAPRAGYPLSAPLLAELGAIAERGGKAILLLNRRGVAPAIHCRACGATRRCPNCDVALTLHGDGSLRCHHCGRVEPLGGDVPGVRLGRARAHRRRHAEARARAREAAARAGADPPRRRRGREARALRDALERFAARRPRRARRHADGREGPPLPRRRARRRRRRRHRPRPARLPRRGAHVPAAHAARRPQRARRAGPRARADVPAGRARRRVRGAARRRRLPRRRARAPPRARLSAVPAPRSHRRHRPRARRRRCARSRS